MPKKAKKPKPEKKGDKSKVKKDAHSNVAKGESSILFYPFNNLT